MKNVILCLSGALVGFFLLKRKIFIFTLRTSLTVFMFILNRALRYVFFFFSFPSNLTLMLERVEAR